MDMITLLCKDELQQFWSNIFDQKSDISVGYERYGTVIANSAKGITISLVDGDKMIVFKLVQSSNLEFTFLEEPTTLNSTL